MNKITTKPVIFITGGTGYIGGTFLQLMLMRDYLNRFTISALVRRRDDAQRMRQLGIEPVIGTLDDLEIIRRESAKADIVFNTANCDHRESAIAIIQGLTKHSKETGKRPILIHTSGAGVLSDNSKGIGVAPEDDPTATIWDDTDFEAHTSIPMHAPHRFVDLEIFAAAKTGLVKTYLVVPPTVFGQGLGHFAEQRMSIQVPRLVYHSLMQRRAMYVGKGENQWTNVHVVDLAELYLLILDAALKDAAPEGLQGFYYPANEYFTWSAVAHRIAQVLHAKQLLATPVATTGLQSGWFWGSNVRMKCSNGVQLGWRPKNGGTQKMLADVEWDTTLMLRMLSMHK
ncbi:Nucleoside-diphosphate-sugar epimerase [Chitinophaga sp. CF118]|uniref:NAD-dependent epimerase/dehydratase family protein n=1 Tax=Chitinophaga sp. CF118 TaxID=1884367 RepID=UPI0008EEC82C|nr:NAD-dependent epimerase/dehydratase family protein [Chitinophaga sp. CF118]SFD17494.1 Nucleoside-diphosphate-sugar epimerase [Chitinophaga sp. CF118]